MDLDTTATLALRPAWRIASFCTSATCVQVAQAAADVVAVRDSKDTRGAVLTFSRAEFSAFVQGVKAGEFDDLC